MSSTIVENGVFQGSVDAYLRDNMTSVGAPIHWGVITSNGLIQRSRNDINSPKRMANPYFDNGINAVSVGTLPFLTQQVLTNDYVKEVVSATYQPNIEGIPIASAEITCTREVETPDYGVIVQENAYKLSVMDNSVPKPRTWDITGYLTSCFDTDHGSMIKPSLVIQAKLLDAFTKSRRPLWFKTDENEFVRVLITNINITRTAENMNTYPIKVSLKEFVPLENINTVSKLRQAAFILTH